MSLFLYIFIFLEFLFSGSPNHYTKLVRYFLNLFGLRGLFSLILGEENGTSWSMNFCILIIYLSYFFVLVSFFISWYWTLCKIDTINMVASLMQLLMIHSAWCRCKWVWSIKGMDTSASWYLLQSKRLSLPQISTIIFDCSSFLLNFMCISFSVIPLNFYEKHIDICLCLNYSRYLSLYIFSAKILKLFTMQVHYYRLLLCYLL